MDTIARPDQELAILRAQLAYALEEIRIARETNARLATQLTEWYMVLADIKRSSTRIN